MDDWDRLVTPEKRLGTRPLPPLTHPPFARQSTWPCTSARIGAPHAAPSRPFSPSLPRTMRRSLSALSFSSAAIRLVDFGRASCCFCALPNPHSLHPPLQDLDAFTDYFGHMSWDLALPFEDKHKDIVGADVRGIPTLKIFEIASGKMITANGRAGVGAGACQWRAPSQSRAGADSRAARAPLLSHTHTLPRATTRARQTPLAQSFPTTKQSEGLRGLAACADKED